MNAELFILQICDFRDDGDGHYRLHEPSRYVSRFPGVVVVDCHYYHRLLPDLIEAADVIVLPFVHNEDFFPLIERRRAAGRATVFEANDYYFDVQSWNTVGPAWQDRAIQEEYRQYMRVADAVQTSTAELARRWRPWARRVAVFPNQLAEIPPLPPPADRPLTVGWGGSPGHFGDWYHVAPALQEWLRARPAVRLAVMTNEYARPFIQIPESRYRFVNFGSLSEYLRFLPELDIGLAPLLPTLYNRCRSDVKYLEYAIHGVVGVYADLEPYRDSVRPGETGLVYRSIDDLIRQLDRLAQDKALRLGLRGRAYEQVAGGRRIQDHIGRRLAFYRELLRALPPGFTVPDAVLSAADVDGRYLRLRPQDGERRFMDAVAGAATEENVRVIDDLLRAYPNYGAALQYQGKFLNDLRQPGRARPYLMRALELDRTSARALSELGRSQFLAGDIDGARRWLTEAVTINPYSQAAWQYLLRLEGLHRHPEGRHWAPRIEKVHPRNFQLALAAVKLFVGGEAVTELGRWLDRFAGGLGSEERYSAAAAYSQAVAETLARQEATGNVLELLDRSCRAFPASARLAELHAWCLHGAGAETQSENEYARALALERQARLFGREYPKPENARVAWLIAEHLRKWTGKPGCSERPGF